MSADALSNELPSAVIAVHTHRVHVARAAVQRAKAEMRLREAHAQAAGVPMGGLKRALRMMTADPERLERQERETAMILAATGCAIQVEQPTLFDTTTDESDEVRALRLRAEGYSAGVYDLGLGVCPYDDDADRAAWRSGFDAFAADLAAFELTDKRRGRR